MNKTVNTVLWVILFLFLLPSSLAVASWNSLPGSRLFTTKLFMEQALVVLIPSASAKGNLQIAYTERRFTEANRMLADQSSVEGLAYLDTQVNTTKNAILTTTDPAVKKQLAQKYIATLETVNAQLEAQKQTIAYSTPQGTPTPIRTIPTKTPTIAPTASATRTPTPTSTPMPAQENPPPATIVSSIENTQENIGSTIQEIEKLSGPKHKENGNNPGNLQNNKQKQENNGNKGGDNRDDGNGNSH